MVKIIRFALLLLLCSNQSYAQKEIKADDYFNTIRPKFTGDLAYETTAFTEKYWRVVGNTGFNKTIYWIAENLEKAGYVLEEKATSTNRLIYRIEKRPLAHNTWEPVSGSLTVLGDSVPLLKQTTNRNMVYLNSVSTPEKGITAKVIHLKNDADLAKLDVRNKIVFYEGNGRKIYEAAIVNGNALGIITYNNPAYLQPEKNITSIQFRSLPYQENTKAWGIALSYQAKEKLKEALKNGIKKLHVNIQTKIYPSEELTIVANVKGNGLPDERLVLSAHIQEPGANDNATGVGTQLEMAVLTAKLLKAKEVDLNRTLTFLWGDEIISTRRYITDNKKRAENIKWGISLDMVGENTAITGGSFLIEKMPDPSAIWTRGKDKHTEWGGEVLNLEDMKPHYLNDFIYENFKKQGKFANWEVNTNPFEGGSDHMPFLDADIPGLLLWHFTDQFYHTDNDRIDKVSKITLKNVGTAALASALLLVNADTKTALSQIKKLQKAAENRMKIEFKLSKQSVKNGNSIANETEILSAWEDWYSNALKSTLDMEKTPSKKLQRAIKKAQQNVKKSTAEHIASLKG